MTKFLCLHTLPPGTLTKQDVTKIAEAAQRDPNVRGYRSFLNLSEGKIACVLEARSKDDVASWFKKMDIPYDSICAVEFEGDRGVIRIEQPETHVVGAA